MPVRNAAGESHLLPFGTHRLKSVRFSLGSKLMGHINSRSGMQSRSSTKTHHALLFRACLNEEPIFAGVRGSNRLGALAWFCSGSTAIELPKGIAHHWVESYILK